MKKLLILLLLCGLLAGCTVMLDIEGKWVTSPEDTLVLGDIPLHRE